MKKCNMKTVQHEKSAAWKQQNMKRVLRGKRATRKECNMKKGQNRKVVT